MSTSTEKLWSPNNTSQASTLNQMDFQNEYKKKGNRDKLDELSRFVWNGKTREFCQRGLKSWGTLLMFYSAFYAVLLAILVTCIGFFSLTIDEIQPKAQGYYSALKGIPGVGFRPMPDFQSSLIRFVGGRPETYMQYVTHIYTYMKLYEQDFQTGENFIDCKNGRPPNSDPNKVCKFEIEKLGSDCTERQDYGFDKSKPCILLKLNRIYGWVPELYTDRSEVPTEISKQWQPNSITVTCEGRYEADQENIGNMTFWPPGGFSRDYYPFLNQQGYRSPLVMVKFNNPTNGMLIHVVCKAWAKNIVHDEHDAKGLVRFELLVD